MIVWSGALFILRRSCFFIDFNSSQRNDSHQMDPLSDVWMRGRSQGNMWGWIHTFEFYHQWHNCLSQLFVIVIVCWNMWGWIHTFEFDRQWFFIIVIRGLNVLHFIELNGWMQSVQCTQCKWNLKVPSSLISSFFALFVPFLNINIQVSPLATSRKIDLVRKPLESNKPKRI